MPDQFSDIHRSISPASAAQQQVTLFCPATNQQGLHVWSALLGLQTFSFLKTKKLFKLLFQLVVEKMETLVCRREGASIFSSGLCFCFSRWGRYRCQQLGQTWRHWPYNRSLPCMPINHSSLVTNNNKIKLFEIGKVCLWLSEQKLFVFCFFCESEATLDVKRNQVLLHNCWCGKKARSMFSLHHRTWIELLTLIKLQLWVE